MTLQGPHPGTVERGDRLGCLFRRASFHGKGLAGHRGLKPKAKRRDQRQRLRNPHFGPPGWSEAIPPQLLLECENPAVGALGAELSKGLETAPGAVSQLVSDQAAPPRLVPDELRGFDPHRQPGLSKGRGGTQRIERGPKQRQGRVKRRSDGWHRTDRSRTGRFSQRQDRCDCRRPIGLLFTEWMGREAKQAQCGLGRDIALSDGSAGNSIAAEQGGIEGWLTARIGEHQMRDQVAEIPGRRAASGFVEVDQRDRLTKVEHLVNVAIAVERDWWRIAFQRQRDPIGQRSGPRGQFRQQRSDILCHSQSAGPLIAAGHEGEPQGVLPVQSRKRRADPLGSRGIGFGDCAGQPFARHSTVPRRAANQARDYQ